MSSYKRICNICECDYLRMTMDCDRFLKISEEWDGKVCIFGAGDYGSTWCYFLLKDAGFNVVCYIDNFKAGNTCNGLPIYTVEYLKEHEELFVFVSTRAEAEREMVKQLVEMGIHNFYYFDTVYAPNDFAQYLDDLGDYELIKKYKSIMDDETYLRILYKYRRREDLNLENPQLFNEKLQYLKLHDRNPLYTKLANKFLVKEYVYEKIGDGHVIPTLFVCDRADEISIDDLPEQFVLKCTHDGGVLICKNKAEFDIEEAKRELDRRLKINYFWAGRAWCYKNIVPQIICEPLITDESETELKDYKVFCFNGVPELIQVDFDRFRYHRRNLYTTEWEFIEGEIEYPSDKNHIIQRPSVLNELLKYAAKLSEGFPHVRTDFYIVGERILLGEMTFYHGNGCEHFFPGSLEMCLGNKIDLGKVWDKHE